MTGAEKIINAMKQVSKSDNQIPSEIVTVTVISINPLIFQLENRLQITSEFYELSNLFDWAKVTVNQVFRAFSFNEGQKYYIVEPYPLQTNLNTGKMDERINQNATAISNLTIVVQGQQEPIGVGKDYYGTVLPENYMWADGSAISRTEYSELFNVIGTAYGAGDGSTTFNLPDKRERVSVMYKAGSTNGTSGATLGTLGAKGGEFKHTQTVEEMPSHLHQLSANALIAYHNESAWNLGSVGTDVSRVIDMLNQGTAQDTTTEYSGSENAMNIMQPYLVCNYIIKVK